ncbi:MAG: hypothetical protein ABFD00_06745, partial [Chloroherpetonaceae bacterium]
LPFDPSMMVHFRKRLTRDILKEVNALIIEKQKQEVQKEHDDHDPSEFEMVRRALRKRIWQSVAA